MSSKGGLTPAQAQFFATILKNMRGKPDVDWKTVADQAGYSSAKTAQTRYGQIMKQLAVDAGEIPKSAATIKSRQEGIEMKPKVGSGTNLGAMKIIKSGARADVKGKRAQQAVRVWDEDAEDRDDGEVEV